MKKILKLAEEFKERLTQTTPEEVETETEENIVGTEVAEPTSQLEPQTISNKTLIFDISRETAEHLLKAIDIAIKDMIQSDQELYGKESEYTPINRGVYENLKKQIGGPFGLY